MLLSSIMDRPRVLNKRLHFLIALACLSVLDTRGDVDRERTNLADSVGDIVRAEAPRKEERALRQAVVQVIPVERAPAPASRVKEHEICRRKAYLCGGSVLHDHCLDDALSCCAADPAGYIVRLMAVELRQINDAAPQKVDDNVLILIDKDAHRLDARVELCLQRSRLFRGNAMTCIGENKTGIIRLQFIYKLYVIVTHEPADFDLHRSP